jgi:hypothetical protein
MNNGPVSDHRNVDTHDHHIAIVPVNMPYLIKRVHFVYLGGSSAQGTDVHRSHVASQCIMESFSVTSVNKRKLCDVTAFCFFSHNFMINHPVLVSCVKLAFTSLMESTSNERHGRPAHACCCGVHCVPWHHQAVSHGHSVCLTVVCSFVSVSKA